MENEKTYIDILFNYKGVFYSERIFTEEIDKDHYDDIWDWWFETKTEDEEPNLVFELTGDKDENGAFTTQNLYINVYDGGYDMEEDRIIGTVSSHDIYYRKSWIDKIGFH